MEQRPSSSIEYVGEEIAYSPGFGPDIASPIATSKVDSSPAYKEIIRLGMTGDDGGFEPKGGETFLTINHVNRRLTKRIAGKSVSVELDPHQYAKLVKMSAGIGLIHNPFRMTLKERLNKEVSSGFKSLGSQSNNDESRRILIKSIIRNYRRLAKHQFLNQEKNITDQFLDAGEARIDALRGR